MVRVDGEEKALTSYQFDLIVALAENAGRVLGRERLMDLVKGEELDSYDRSIEADLRACAALVERWISPVGAHWSEIVQERQ
jgi:two-component system phosphate regulon response regulator OmpR